MLPYTVTARRAADTRENHHAAPPPESTASNAGSNPSQTRRCVVFAQVAATSYGRTGSLGNIAWLVIQHRIFAITSYALVARSRPVVATYARCSPVALISISV